MKLLELFCLSYFAERTKNANSHANKKRPIMVRISMSNFHNQYELLINCDVFVTVEHKKH